MHQSRTFKRVFFLTAAVGLLAVAPVIPQVGGPNPKIQVVPRLQPIAEAQVLMRGINRPNLEALNRLLKHQPDKGAWSQIRDHALVIAENGNLLMLRPVRKQNEETWLDRAAALRSKASDLARAAEGRDLGRCQAELKDLAMTCNRCHQTFGVDVQVRSFADDQPGARFAPPAVPPVPEPPPLPRPPAPPAPSPRP
jgi:hypothetical protein